MLIASVVQNAHQNFSIRVLGECGGTEQPFEYIDLKELTKDHTHKIEGKMLKLSSALWLIQEKLGVNLYWGGGKPSLDRLIFPMESRNSVRFEQGVMSPKEWNQVLTVETFGFSRDPVPTKRFVILLDFDK